MRLVPHAIHAKQTGAKRLVILSGDTHVMVLALYFNTDLKTNGLSELCVLVWVILQDITLHLILEMNPELCSVLPAIHILTGCDTTSKVGTKLSALKPPAAQLLSQYEKSLSSPNQAEIIHKAQQSQTQQYIHYYGRASDFFQDSWAKVTHGAKNGGSFSKMMGPSISN